MKMSFILDEHDKRIKKIMSKGKHRLKLLDQRILRFQHGLAFPLHHFLYPSLSEKVQQLITSGIIEQWETRIKNHRYVIEKPPESEPAVLTMDHLEIGFQIWLAMLLIAFIAFLAEIVYYRSKNLRELIYNRLEKRFLSMLQRII